MFLLIAIIVAVAVLSVLARFVFNRMTDARRQSPDNLGASSPSSVVISGGEFNNR